MGRAHEDQVRQALALQVIGVAALAGHEGGVFDAAHGVAAAKAQGVQAGGGVGGVHAAAPESRVVAWGAWARIACAASRTAATMLT